MLIGKQPNDDITITYLLRKLEEKLMNVLKGKVSKSGDTMTGNLTMDKTSVSLRSNFAKTDTVSSETWGTRVNLLDKNGNQLGLFTSALYADGKAGAWFGARRVEGSTNYYNGVGLRLASDGTPAVVVSSPKLWKEALGLGTEEQNFNVTPSGEYSGQIANMSFKDLNSLSSYNGHNMMLVITDTGLFLWDSTSSASRWALEMPVSIAHGGTGQSAVTATSGSTVGTAATNMTLTAISAKVWGKLAMIFVQVKTGVAISASTQTTLCTLKSGYRPPSQAPGIVFSTSPIGYAFIEAGGAVKVAFNGNVSANSTIYVQATYILA